MNRNDIPDPYADPGYEEQEQQKNSVQMNLRPKRSINSSNLSSGVSGGSGAAFDFGGSAGAGGGQDFDFSSFGGAQAAQPTPATGSDLFSFDKNTATGNQSATRVDPFGFEAQPVATPGDLLANPGGGAGSGVGDILFDTMPSGATAPAQSNPETNPAFGFPEAIAPVPAASDIFSTAPPAQPAPPKEEAKPVSGFVPMVL